MRKKLSKLVVVTGLLISLVSSSAFASTLDDLYQQKRDLQNSISASGQQIKNLQDMIGSLDSQTAATNKQISITNQIIDLTNQEISDTQGQIEQKQKELDKKKADLKETVVTFYETGNPSSLEIIAGSNNLSDVIDRSQYMQALSDQVNNQAQEIAKVKADLESKKNDLEKKEADLEDQKTSLTDQQRNLKIQADTKNRLLSQEKSEKSQLEGDLDNVSAAIYAERRRLGGYVSGGTGGYPWANDTPCSNGGGPCPSDDWGFGVRQCTSFAAWYWNDVLGKSWYRQLPPGQNNATNWPILAQMQGYGVYSSPKVGDIVSWPSGGIFGSAGHVAIVIKVPGNNANSEFRVAQYNWDPYNYSEMDVYSNLAPSARFIR